MAWLPWSGLLRFSQSQLVVYGTYATLLIPIVAQAMSYAGEIWPPALPSGATRPPASSDTQWRLFALWLYFGGLLLFIARLLTQLACPSRIQRFPYEDDYLILAGEINAAKSAIDGAGKPEEEGGDSGAAAALARATAISLASSTATLDAWRRDNRSRRAVRVTTAALYMLGSTGVVAYLSWRAIENIGVVIGLAR
jgi:hypothetical protein